MFSVIEYIFPFDCFNDLASIHLICIADIVTSLSVQTHVPAHAITNGTAHLDCSFKLEDDRLQLEAVKWHKDYKVFYVYAPAKQPVGQRYSVPGVSANVSVTHKPKNCCYLFVHDLSFFRI